eukprot:1220120-Pyramimonas_sp.AAC.1
MVGSKRRCFTRVSTRGAAVVQRSVRLPNNKESVVTPTAIPDYDDSTKQSSKRVQTKTTRMQVDPPLSTAALTRSWVLDSGSAHHIQ